MKTEILLLLTPVLTFIVGIYIRSLITKIESFDKTKTDVEMIKKENMSLSKIKDDWAAMRLEITKLIVDMEYIKKTHDELAVIKRDQSTMWRHIDSLKKFTVESGDEKCLLKKVQWCFSFCHLLSC